MARTTSVGRLLLNSALPSSHQITEATSKKDLKNLLIDLARTDPNQYVEAVAAIKRIGDEVTTDMGITVGLDDIEPDYARRDPILKPAIEHVRKTKDDATRIKIIQDTQARLLDSTRHHPGQMTMMATSGARGKLAQLMRTVGSPVAVVDANKKTIPWIISRSYAEGLKAPDTWAEMTESRRNVVEANLAVSEPGAVGKLLVFLIRRLLTIRWPLARILKFKTGGDNQDLVEAVFVISGEYHSADAGINRQAAKFPPDAG